MFSWINNAIKSGTSFLTNLTPPGVTDKQEAERLSCINHLESKKFFIVFTSVLILCFFFFLSTGILFFLPPTPEIITGFVTLFTKTSEILAVVIAAYVSVQAAVDFKINSNSTTAIANQSQTVNQNINENKTQTLIEEITVIHTNSKEDDYELE